MYVPEHFRNADPGAALDWLRRFPFGTLITRGPGGEPAATSLPFFAEVDGMGVIRLVSHLARRNPHATSLVSGMRGLVVINGPSAYISPRWYQSPVNVPTWDYVGLQWEGVMRVIDDRDGLLDLMRRSARAFEPDGGAGWHLADAPAEHVDRLIGGVVGFELAVEVVHCMEKLSQNKLADRARIQAELRSGTTAFGPLVAQLMDDSGK
ncbi:MAG: FMN-binding negative transcriptional regulator [Variovorax paradoxus]|uniref:FMN-binding negative transcriptional regulator n=1 Tax=Variovorax paradoxus TaxID=34073 RepID=A0A2W5SRN1_VARPD|nr:MAG: FMN-binding negative transcriptional regulator [Variovorax paradoxus]